MKNAIIILSLIFFSFQATVFAQDIILKKDGTKIKAKVKEIGKTDIKYLYFDDLDGPLLVIDINDVASVKLNGKKDHTVVFQDDPMAVSNKAILDKTKVIKFHMFSPIDGYLGLTQEWVHKPGFNWEVGVGAIGAGFKIKKSEIITPVSQLSGFFVRGGPKFLLGNSDDVEVDGVHYKYAHPIKGRYFKIEGVLNSFSRTAEYQKYDNFLNPDHKVENIKMRYSSIGLNFIYGRQLIVGNLITIGYYVGLGYAYEYQEILKYPESYDGNTYDFKANRYSHFAFSNNIPITGTCGITLGYIYKNWPWHYKSSKLERNVQPSRHSMED